MAIDPPAPRQQNAAAAPAAPPRPLTLTLSYAPGRGEKGGPTARQAPGREEGGQGPNGAAAAATIGPRRFSAEPWPRPPGRRQGDPPQRRGTAPQGDGAPARTGRGTGAAPGRPRAHCPGRADDPGRAGRKQRAGPPGRPERTGRRRSAEAGGPGDPRPTGRAAARQGKAEDARRAALSPPGGKAAARTKPATPVTCGAERRAGAAMPGIPFDVPGSVPEQPDGVTPRFRGVPPLENGGSGTQAGNVLSRSGCPP